MVFMIDWDDLIFYWTLEFLKSLFVFLKYFFADLSICFNIFYWLCNAMVKFEIVYKIFLTSLLNVKCSKYKMYME